MRIMLLAILGLALAGCVSPTERATVDARAVCASNGHPQGSPGFDACFNAAFAAIYQGQARIRASLYQ